MGPEAVPGIVAQMRKPRRREDLSFLLALMGERAISPLLKLLTDPQLNIFAGMALQRVANSSSAAHAEEFLACMKFPDVNNYCGMALAQSMSPQSADKTPLLIAALKDSSADTRQYATIALGCIGPKARAAVPELIPLLNDPSPEVQVAAVTTLGNIGPRAKAALPALKAKLAASPNPAAARTITSSLEKIGK